MDTNHKREAAARELLRQPCSWRAAALLELCGYPKGVFRRQYQCADGTVSADVAVVVASWTARVHALDAYAAMKLAALRALEGLELVDASAVLTWSQLVENAPSSSSLSPAEQEQAKELARRKDLCGADNAAWCDALSEHAKAQISQEAARETGHEDRLPEIKPATPLAGGLSDVRRKNIEDNVRAFDGCPGEVTACLVLQSIRASAGQLWMPDGEKQSIPDLRSVGAWISHVRVLDAANAAPVAPDSLAGVVWRKAAPVAQSAAPNVGHAAPAAVTLEDATTAAQACETKAVPAEVDVECCQCGAVFDLSARHLHACPMQGGLPTLAVKATPFASDPLAEITWETPRQIAEWGEQVEWPRGHQEFGVSFKDSVISDRLMNSGTATMVQISAHARAQIAREATETEASETRFDRAIARARKYAPAVPAVTLEDAATDALRAELERRGGTVTMPKMGGFYNAPGALRALDALIALCADDREALRAGGCWSGGGAPERIAKSLRDLGVAPAALS